MPGRVRRHARHLRGELRGQGPAVPQGQGRGLGHRRVRHAAARDQHAHPARGRQGRPLRPNARDPAADRKVAARGRGHEGARRTHDLGRLRRAPGGRGYALRVDHGCLRRARRGPAPEAPPRRPGRAARDRLRRRGLGRQGGRLHPARPQLRGRLERPRRHEHREDRPRPFRRGARHRRGPTLQRGRAGGADGRRPTRACASWSACRSRRSATSSRRPASPSPSPFQPPQDPASPGSRSRRRSTRAAPPRRTPRLERGRVRPRP